MSRGGDGLVVLAPGSELWPICSHVQSSEPVGAVELLWWETHNLACLRTPPCLEAKCAPGLDNNGVGVHDVSTARCILCHGWDTVRAASSAMAGTCCGSWQVRRCWVEEGDDLSLHYTERLSEEN